MSRTNIDIDDDLVATVMQRYQLRTKKDAVDYALRRLVGKRLSRDEILAYQGAHLIDAPVDEPHPSPDADR